jgi:hypothetical protein
VEKLANFLELRKFLHFFQTKRAGIDTLLLIPMLEAKATFRGSLMTVFQTALCSRMQAIKAAITGLFSMLYKIFKRVKSFSMTMARVRPASNGIASTLSRIGRRCAIS